MDEQRVFDSGAVRDNASGKGRCDLLPMDTIAELIPDSRPFFLAVEQFQQTGSKDYLYSAAAFLCGKNASLPGAVLDLAIHFQRGALHYGDRNWEKGIPASCYIDSGIRHYLKYRAGYADEPHLTAALWNIVCCIWTCVHRPWCNDYAKEESQ